MITSETRGDTTIITILDDAGRDADLEILFKDRGPNITVRQKDMTNHSDGIIVATPTQAHFLMAVLQEIIGEEDEAIH
ncbi:hypothetical protein [Bradyrhizobium sp. SZCCHNRI2049]|uniref:hypothetical protein n=1 Tax=Bradyrhizobium sp. SZCCHNRI2049 TaxID=3057287 RepID=UPI002915CF4C|nr:hypothetical protein [Bradyrhizobium sp. SZCCHNRI2049]